MNNREFWSSKRFTVTGGAGFLGSHVVEQLRRLGARDVCLPTHSEYDLRDQRAVERMFADCKPDVVLHLAAVVGGIGANKQKPGTFFYDNAIMGIQVMEQARRNNVLKFVGLGTTCSYPKHTPVPFREDDLWNGYPEETNAPYGLAKKMLLVQAQAYRQQYGFNAITLFPSNLYGPRDNFNLETSHVIPALIRRFHEAKVENNREIVLWGTGTPTREFLFVEDAADAILMATRRYDRSDPVNIGSGEEISIKDLAGMIAEIIGYTGEIRWDSSRPDGQPLRKLDVSRARDYFGFTAQTPLRQGLMKTVDWYVQQQLAGKK